MTTHFLETEEVQMPEFISHSLVADNVSVPLLEVLVKHGYDFDRDGRQDTIERGENLIDYPKVLKNDEVVRWLVEHGASLDRGQDTFIIIPMPAPLLETAAVYASVPTFKFLLERGAKLGRRTLHCAVEYAAGIKADPTAPADSPAYDPSKKFASDRKRMAEMLPYLVDELKLDVNANDLDVELREKWFAEQGAPEITTGHTNFRPSGHHGTPLCYAVHHNGTAIVKWLLSKGADPMCGGDHNLDASLTAKSMKYDKILELFEEWEKRKEQFSGGSEV